MKGTEKTPRMPKTSTKLKTPRRRDSENVVDDLRGSELFLLLNRKRPKSRKKRRQRRSRRKRTRQQSTPQQSLSGVV